MATTAWTNQQIAEKVKQILAQELNVEESAITPNSRMEGDLGGDSLDRVEIVMHLEEVFEIEIPDDDLDQLKTYQGLVDYVTRKTSEK